MQPATVNDAPDRPVGRRHRHDELRRSDRGPRRSRRAPASAYSTSYTATVSGAQRPGGQHDDRPSPGRSHRRAAAAAAAARERPDPARHARAPIPSARTSARSCAPRAERVQHDRRLAARAGQLAGKDLVVLGEVGAERGAGDGPDRLRERRRQPRGPAAGRQARPAARAHQGHGHARRTATSRSIPPSRPRPGSPPPRCSTTARADRYTLSGATSVANLYTSATAATTEPGGVAADGRQQRRPGRGVHLRPRALGRVHAPGQSRLGRRSRATACSRSARTSCSAASPCADWVNLAKVSIPQADEQQRLLANLIETMNRHRKPLPRFWYFPRVAQGRGRGHRRRSRERRHRRALRPVPRQQPRRLLGDRLDLPALHVVHLHRHAAHERERRRPTTTRASRSALHPDTDCEDFTPGQPRADLLDAALAVPREVQLAARARRPTGRTAWSGATGSPSRRRSWRTACGST